MWSMFAREPSDTAVVEHGEVLGGNGVENPADDSFTSGSGLPRDSALSLARERHGDRADAPLTPRLSDLYRVAGPPGSSRPDNRSAP